MSETARRSSATPLTVAALAEAKRLPVAFLERLGLHHDGPAVAIPYRDAAGVLLAVKRRTALKASEGSWWPKGVPLAAYGQWRLDEAKKAGCLFLVEGESDCWTLWHHGLPALGLPGACTAHTLEGEHLDDVATVYVAKEPDQGGEVFAQSVAARLPKLGYTGRAFELVMPDGIKDVSALHLQAGDRFRGRLEEAVQSAAPLEPRPTGAARKGGRGAPYPPGEWAGSPYPRARAGARSRVGAGSPAPAPPEPAGLQTTGLDAIRPEPLRWLVPGYLPLGKLVLIAGDGGHGKSTLTLGLAACVTRGVPGFALSYENPVTGEVLLVSCEDDFADTVVPRLLAAGADLSRVRRVDGVKDAGGAVMPFCLVHCEQIEQELSARPAVRLVVIDPASAYVSRSGVDDYRDADLRALLGPLAELAARRQVTVVLVKHLSKNQTAKAVHQVGGSVGYVNTVRAAFLVTPDPQDDARKLFLPLKFNLGPSPAGLAFRLAEAPAELRAMILGRCEALGAEDRQRLGRQLFRAEWLGETEADADEVLTHGGTPDPVSERDARRAAVFLEQFLKAGPREAMVCVTEGNAALWFQRSLDWWRRRVLREQLGGQSRKTGFGEAGRWWFTLPGHFWPPPHLQEGVGGKDAKGYGTPAEEEKPAASDGPYAEGY